MIFHGIDGTVRDERRIPYENYLRTIEKDRAGPGPVGAASDPFLARRRGGGAVSAACRAAGFEQSGRYRPDVSGADDRGGGSDFYAAERGFAVPVHPDCRAVDAGCGVRAAGCGVSALVLYLGVPGCMLAGFCLAGCLRPKGLGPQKGHCPGGGSGKPGLHLADCGRGRSVFPASQRLDGVPGVQFLNTQL